MGKAAHKGAPARITFDELNEKLRDLSISDAEIAQYLTADPSLSTPMRPVLRPDPRRVAMSEFEERRVRGAMAMNWANGVARWRREQNFLIRLKAHPEAPVLVSEGDSWFQFPFFLDDVIDQLSLPLGPYNILSTCAAGDTVRHMLGPRPDYANSLARLKAMNVHPRALLFSGGGNDIIDFLAGKDGESAVLNEFKAGEAAPYYTDNVAFRTKIGFVRDALDAFLTRMAEEQKGLPIILHGYDRPIPGTGKNDWRKPLWAKIDEWLAGPMARRGITDHALQTSIAAHLIDQHNVLMQSLAARHANVHFIDLRGTVSPKEHWADEIHPTNDGFKAVALKFQAVLRPLTGAA